MLGLRTQESKKFEKFMKLVQAEAKKTEKVFFLDTGDGHDFETDELEGEDLAGWLIPSSKVIEFKEVWEKDSVDDEWSDFYMFAVWKNENNKIVISFEAS
ncbi:MAG: hypothetical protein IKW21_04185 [Lachnospiraceae bacterium]|nr:hypothetical protein [Lachnospiraceae bacterium]